MVAPRRPTAADLRRLERAAYLMNPFLTVIVIGLIIVNVSCYAALEIGRLHIRKAGLSRLPEPAPSFGQIVESGMPQF